MRRYRWLAFAPLLIYLGLAEAASTFPLPAWMCASDNDVVFLGGFECGEAVPRDPSNGSGGPYPGDQSRVITVAGSGH